MGEVKLSDINDLFEAHLGGVRSELAGVNRRLDTVNGRLNSQGQQISENVRDIATLAPSGGQEKGYRRGTENVPAAAGFAAALQSRAFADAMPRLTELRGKLEQSIVEAGGMVIAGNGERIPTIGAYAMPGVASASQLVQFDLAGIAVSAGSACSSGSMKPSRVLDAMRVPPEIAGSVIRVSFGPDTSADDVERFLAEWRRIAAKAGSKAA